MLAVFNKTKKNNNFYHIFNIGGEKTISINVLVKKLEKLIGLKAKKKNMPKISLDPDYSLANFKKKKLKKFVKKIFLNIILIKG